MEIRFAFIFVQKNIEFFKYRILFIPRQLILSSGYESTSRAASEFGETKTTKFQLESDLHFDNKKNWTDTGAMQLS